MSEQDVETETTDLEKVQTVRIKEDGVSYVGVAAPPLSRKAFYARLSDADKDRVLAGEVSVDDLRPKREEEIVSGEAALIEASEFVTKYKNKVMASEEARKVLALRALVDGTDPARVKEITGLNYNVYRVWLEPRSKETPRPVTDKDVVKKIKAAIKKAEDAEKKE